MTQGVNFGADGVFMRSPFWGMGGNIFFKRS